MLILLFVHETVEYQTVYLPISTTLLIGKMIGVSMGAVHSHDADLL
jgi:hypothetical protein